MRLLCSYLLGQIRIDHSARFTSRNDLALTEQDCTITQGLNRRHIVANEKYCSTRSRYIVHFAEAFLLKPDIADGQHFSVKVYFANEPLPDNERPKGFRLE